ncbi:vitelline membrane outer layer protein 1-like [Daphnia pulex]|uniref:vitelline membrane outer layer protein 1-like n=1 Tax=Daphnia pulex TaxID=6669 RepID=UPI001EDCD8B0|nr:vitelline membrane outer layer protein 1-like [Daphnia pulex]XP_046461609.1 vitelline membrane outer layer protein 1-like [Daphnia pulex]XP_046461610.1 vitelline membrane outer layer protein 1-like [Daphnia pulex]
MAKPMQFVTLTAVLYCFLPATVTATFWGDWGKVEHCPEGERATGFSLKTEREQGRGDDTALNAIALICTSGRMITSTQGPWGNWGGRFVCQSGSYITSCQLRVEPPQGSGDDTSANNLNCKCSNGETLNGDGTSWGGWNAWSSPCENGIMAIQTRVEGHQGKRDDTALNDVQFTCFLKRNHLLLQEIALNAIEA